MKKFWKRNKKDIKPQGASPGCAFIPALFLMLLITSGCGNKFFDPSQVGRFDHAPSVTAILETLGVAEEKPIAWEQGEEPRAIDTVVVHTDYTFKPGDTVRIFIDELLHQGETYAQECTVSETGRISIPVVGDLQVEGKTETQLQAMIENVLKPNILINPLVNATLIQSQQQIYSIQGEGVKMPGKYSIPRYGIKLLEALGQAGGSSQLNVSYIYVTRQVQKSESGSGTSKNNIRNFQSIQSAYNLPEPVRPQAVQPKQETNRFPASKIVVSTSEMVVDRETNRYPVNNNQNRNYTSGRLRRNTYQLSDMQAENEKINNRISVEEALKRVTGEPVDMNEVSSIPYQKDETPKEIITQQPPEKTNGERQPSHIEWIFQDGAWVPVVVETPGGGKIPVTQGTGKIPATSETERIPDSGIQTQDGEIEWVIKDGKWVPVQKGAPKEIITEKTKGKEPTKTDKEITWAAQEEETRLIKIPIDKLIAGESRYNIVIKPGDTILVPVDVAGFYYLMGNLNHAGAVEMKGGRVTLKQAIATAGNLGPLAWPKRCEIIREIGRNQQVTVRVDLDKIFSGELPDIYIKPNDVINIGTHATSRWRAILRNAFRATYGVGFVYDRNFADRDFYTSRPFGIFE